MFTLTTPLLAFPERRTHQELAVVPVGVSPRMAAVKAQAKFPGDKFFTVLCRDDGSPLMFVFTNAAGNIVATTIFGEVDEVRMLDAANHVFIERLEIESAVRQPGWVDLNEPTSEAEAAKIMRELTEESQSIGADVKESGDVPKEVGVAVLDDISTPTIPGDKS